MAKRHEPRHKISHRLLESPLRHGRRCAAAEAGCAARRHSARPASRPRHRAAHGVDDLIDVEGLLDGRHRPGGERGRSAGGRHLRLVVMQTYTCRQASSRSATTSAKKVLALRPGPPASKSTTRHSEHERKYARPVAVSAASITVKPASSSTACNVVRIQSSSSRTSTLCCAWR